MEWSEVVNLVVLSIILGAMSGIICAWMYHKDIVVGAIFTILFVVSFGLILVDIGTYTTANEAIQLARNDLLLIV